MRTEKQREASRNNGRLSRGPITPEGKARSAQNAITHGIYAKSLILPNESEAHFQEFYDHLIHDLAPATAYEKDLAIEIIACRWRLRRSFSAETANIAFQMEAKKEKIAKTCAHIEESVRISIALRDLADESTSLNAFRRHEISLSRQCTAVEKRLAELQRERLATQSAEPEKSQAPEPPTQRPLPPIENDPTPGPSLVPSTPQEPSVQPPIDQAA